MGGAWVSIGPSVVRQGQTFVRSPTSGRVTGLALALVDQRLRVYLATANDGAWRSDDYGQTWYPLMDGLTPPVPPSPAETSTEPLVQQASPSSLACGAIDVSPTDPDRVYVGSGEGMEGAYFGIGPLMSPDGGKNWFLESSVPTLEGSSFYALAVDPTNKEQVVGATYQGLYHRVPNGPQKYQWVQKTSWTPTDKEGRTARATSVVAARRGGGVTFFAARWGGPVCYFNSPPDWKDLESKPPEGESVWKELGTKFPADVADIDLAVLPDNPDVVYALAANKQMVLQGLYRYDASDPAKEWRLVAGVPADLFGMGQGQGWYDMAIAIAPDNLNRVYVGGAGVNLGGDWSAALYRLEVSAPGPEGSFSATSAYIGDTVHADVHALAFTPGQPNQLWVGCDGGVFCSVQPPTGGPNVFAACNTGLATLMMISLAQHPTQAAVLFGGTQDNGCLRYTGEEAWLYSADGDGGAVLVNWRDPYKVLSIYTEGKYRWSTDGGPRRSYLEGWVPLADTEKVEFYPPLAAPPPNPANPVQADLVAFGSERLWINTTFGVQGWTPFLLVDNWEPLSPQQAQAGVSRVTIKALAFASGDRLYVATTAGTVYRFDNEDDGWKRKRLDEDDQPRQLLIGPITCIAVDPADASGSSIYITFGGQGKDYRRIWHYDPSRPPNQHWQAQSGPKNNSGRRLAPVQFNTLVVDPLFPDHLYAAADDGMWRSVNRGTAWQRFNAGLPSAAVVDLLLFRYQDHGQPKALLRAATHGRSVFERDLEGGPERITLYVRHTSLDLGRYPTVNDLDDPTRQGTTVLHTRSPDIKLVLENVPAGSIDFLAFQDGISDFADAMRNAKGRVFVLVHNRGTRPASKLLVVLLWANTRDGLPPLPEGYDEAVRQGKPFNNDWRTIGIETLNDVRAGVPQVAGFPWPPPDFPEPPSGTEVLGLLALVHHADDPFVSPQRDSNILARVERKAAMKLLSVR
jgi:hypothetical protein